MRFSNCQKRVSTRYICNPATVILRFIAPELLAEDDLDLMVEIENLTRELAELQKKHTWLSFWEPTDTAPAAHQRWELRLNDLEFQMQEIEEEVRTLENELDL